jgi:hypothetical protein
MSRLGLYLGLPVPPRAAAPPSLPDPSTVPGLGLWLQDNHGVWEDTSRTDEAEDADPVAGWTDRSSAARHGSQASVSARPTLRLSGDVGIESGVDDSIPLLSTITLDANAGWTCYFVVHVGSGASRIRTITSGNETQRIFFNISGGEMAVIATDPVTGNCTAAMGAGSGSTGLKVVRITREPDSNPIIVNMTGVSGAKTGSGANVFSSLAISHLWYGGQLAGCENYRLRAAIIYPATGVLSAGNKAVVEDWIEAEFGVTL